MSSSQHSTTPIKKNPQVTNPKTESFLSSQTPDKPAPQRRNVAMSISDIRKSARDIRASKRAPPRDEGNRIKSARKQILLDDTPVKNRNIADNLPEKYEMLAQFFDSLDSSLRLLKLKGRKMSFSNICVQVQNLTDRRFSYAHLAQMKYLLPEAIEVKRILVLDEQTCCREPDLQVSLNMEILENGEKVKCESLGQLRKVFRTRLIEFVKSHPEGDEIPAVELPLKQKQPEVIKPLVSREIPIDTVTNRQPVVASHLPITFRKRFSQRFSDKEAKKTVQNESESSIKQTVTSFSEDPFKKVSSLEETRSAVQSPAESSLGQTKDEEFLGPNTSASSSLSLNTPVAPSKERDCTKSSYHSPSGVVGNQSTPAKLVLTPSRLMTMTPSVNKSKRSDISPADDSECSMNKLARRPPRIRSLKFDDDLDDLLPVELLQSIREKDKKTMEELDPAISQAKRRKQMIASLPKLFNTIRYLFQSLARSVITKSELLQKLVASHLDVAERNEVEEQLDLLFELVPDWISEKLGSAGDLLVSVKKIADVESIRQQLEQAK